MKRADTRDRLLFFGTQANVEITLKKQENCDKKHDVCNYFAIGF